MKTNRIFKILRKVLCTGAMALAPIFAIAEETAASEGVLKSVIKGQSIYNMPLGGSFLFADVVSQATAEQASEVQNLPPYIKQMPEGDPVEFHEVWGYVMTDRLYEYDSSMPITDLCFFSADINSYGEITTIPSPSGIRGFTGRKHLVVTCEGRSLTHFVLDPQYGIRQKIIRRLTEAVRQYDGIQIDFETIPARDAQNFISFLGDVRSAIGSSKWMSVCVPARTKVISDDIFLYSKITPYVDRVIVMAYDEHWSGSVPGSIASMDWCENVASYATSVIPEKKLVMGLPFYGRTWEDASLAKAWYFSGINRVLNENQHPEVQYDNEVPMFSYETTVKITGYFEDVYSLVQRCRMYQGMNVKKIAFWRIGQEDPEFWPWLRIN